MILSMILDVSCSVANLETPNCVKILTDVIYLPLAEAHGNARPKTKGSRSRHYWRGR